MRFSRLIASTAVSLLVLGSVLPLTLGQAPKSHSDYSWSAPCTLALARRVVCGAANQHALEYMKANNLNAVTVVQNVRTGALVAFAASEPAQLDVSTGVLPLSVVKLFLAVSWWQHTNANDFMASDGSHVSIHEMIVSGSDNAGRFTATELRKKIGTDGVIKDLGRFGFPVKSTAERLTLDEHFWADLDPAWRDRLTPAASHNELNASTPDDQWGYDLSIGEAGFSVTALSISRFLQAVGNDGVMLSPTARGEMFTTIPSPQSKTRIREQRVMSRAAALKLQAAMRDVVRRGTAKAIASALEDAGWSIGGKTGSSGPVGPQSDGWFAGIIFDSRQKPRFTVATFVRHGGTGGGNAAKLSADLARYLIPSVHD